MTSAAKSSAIRLTPTRSASLERDTLWDRSYASLRGALLAGRYRPGDRIVLRQVADDLGISLTPVRDAVNRLIAERVLERGGVGQAGGAVVPMLPADQFAQLMTVRASLEPTAAAAAAMKASVRELEAVAAALAAMKRAVENRQTARYLQAHQQFHFGIYTICRMQIVQEIIESVWLRCGPTLNLALPEYKPGLKRFPFHEQALAALERGEGERAAQAIRSDIDSAREDVCAMLAKRERGQD